MISEVMVISDDAHLAAQVSCIFAKRGVYLSVVDGPRMQRHDHMAEVIRRTNAAARAKAPRFVLCGLDDTAAQAIEAKLPRGSAARVQTESDVSVLSKVISEKLTEPLAWGRDRIGIGLLKALRANQPITFSEDASPDDYVDSKSDHLVVCEQGEELAQVVAANYAFAIGAGLCLIPETTQRDAEAVLERFYGLYDDPHASQSETLETLRRELRERAGSIPIPPGGSVIFITDSLPYGFAFSEVPSTHLFRYPDLGISVIHGFAAEQSGSRGTQVATLVNPDTTPAPEIDAAAKLLAERRTFVRGYQGRRADVSSISDMIELFPYDLMLIATHCGDASGYRWTYKFTDSEGLARTLVVDVAVGFGRTEDPQHAQCDAVYEHCFARRDDVG